MLRVEMVREMVARRERGQGVKRIAREPGVDRKTAKRWLRLGAWRPRRTQRRARQLDRFADFSKQRAPEVGRNGAVLYGWGTHAQSVAKADGELPPGAQSNHGGAGYC